MDPIHQLLQLTCHTAEPFSTPIRTASLIHQKWISVRNAPEVLPLKKTLESFGSFITSHQGDTVHLKSFEEISEFHRTLLIGEHEAEFQFHKRLIFLYSPSFLFLPLYPAILDKLIWYLILQSRSPKMFLEKYLCIATRPFPSQ